MANVNSSKEIIVYVAGYSGLSENKNYKGIGKSYLCHKLIRPDIPFKHYSSCVGGVDFISPVVNESHWLYWGKIIQQHDNKQYNLKFIEKTEFLNVDTYELFRNDESTDYVERCKSCETGRKVSYQGTYISVPRNDEILITESNNKPHIALLLYDASSNNKSFVDQQNRVFKSLLNLFLNEKVPIIIIITKCDIPDHDILTSFNNLITKKASRIPRIYTSAINGINIEIIPHMIIELLFLKHVKLDGSYERGVYRRKENDARLKDELKNVLTELLSTNLYAKWDELKNDIKIKSYLIKLNNEDCSTIFNEVSKVQIQKHQKNQNNNVKTILFDLLSNYEHLINYKSQDSFEGIIRDTDFQSHFIEFSKPIEYFQLSTIATTQISSDNQSVILPKYLIDPNNDNNMIFIIKRFVASRTLIYKLLKELMKDWFEMCHKSVFYICEHLSTKNYYDINKETILNTLNKFKEIALKLLKLKLIDMFHQYGPLYPAVSHWKSLESNVRSDEFFKKNISEFRKKLQRNLLDFPQDNFLKSNYNFDLKYFEDNCIKIYIDSFSPTNKNTCVYESLSNEFEEFLETLPNQKDAFINYSPHYICSYHTMCDTLNSLEFLNRNIVECCEPIEIENNHYSNDINLHHRLVILSIDVSENGIVNGIGNVDYHSFIKEVQDKLNYDEFKCNIHAETTYKTEIFEMTLSQLQATDDNNNNNTLPLFCCNSDECLQYCYSCSRLCIVLYNLYGTNEIAELFQLTNEIIESKSTNQKLILTENILRYAIVDSVIQQIEISNIYKNDNHSYIPILSTDSISYIITRGITMSLITPEIWVVGYCGVSTDISRSMTSKIVDNLQISLTSSSSEDNGDNREKYNKLMHIKTHLGTTIIGGSFCKFNLLDDSNDCSIYDTSSNIYDEIGVPNVQENFLNNFRIHFLSYHQAIQSLHNTNASIPKPTGAILITDIHNKACVETMIKLKKQLRKMNIHEHLLGIYNDHKIMKDLKDYVNNKHKSEDVKTWNFYKLNEKSCNDKLVNFFQTVLQGTPNYSSNSTATSTIKSYEYANNSLSDDFIYSSCEDCQNCCNTCRTIRSRNRTRFQNENIYETPQVGDKNKNKFTIQNEYDFDQPKDSVNYPIKLNCLYHYENDITKYAIKRNETSRRPFRTRIRSQSGPELQSDNIEPLLSLPIPEPQTILNNSTESVNSRSTTSTHSKSHMSRHSCFVNNQTTNETASSSSSSCLKCGRIFSYNFCDSIKSSDKTDIRCILKQPHHHHHLPNLDSVDTKLFTHRLGAANCAGNNSSASTPGSKRKLININLPKFVSPKSSTTTKPSLTERFQRVFSSKK